MLFYSEVPEPLLEIVDQEVKIRAVFFDFFCSYILPSIHSLPLKYSHRRGNERNSNFYFLVDIFTRNYIIEMVFKTISMFFYAKNAMNEFTPDQVGMYEAFFLDD